MGSNFIILWQFRWKLKGINNGTGQIVIFLQNILEYSIGDYKISAPFNNYIMETILSDAESCEKHGETKYSHIGPTMAEL